ncbi:DMT family transporter [Maridesulfovibrio sp.]|uniref:DMT family transporter n=1 Tax=Maridesulfovibrio sp. TaxID=2795000 RepID=UPI003BA8B087
MINPVYIAVGLAMVLWSSCFVGIRAALQDFTPEHLAVFRFIFASAAMLLYAPWAKVRMPHLKDIPALFLHGFLGYTAFSLAINHGESLISAGSTSFIIATVPVFATILAVITLKEKVSPRTYIGLSISMIGIGIISFGEGGGISLNIGALFVLIAAISDSIYIVLQKPFFKKYTAYEYTTYTMVTGTILLCVYLPGLPEQIKTASWHSIGATIHLGVFGTAIPYALWTYGVSKADVSKIVMSQYTIPVMALLVGYVWLGEIPPLLAIFGGGIALAGAVLSSISFRTLKRFWQPQPPKPRAEYQSMCVKPTIQNTSNCAHRP